MASRAKGHLTEARRLADKLPREARQLMLPALAVDAYLTALEKAGFDLYDPALLRVPNYLSHVLSVKYNHMRGTY